MDNVQYTLDDLPHRSAPAASLRATISRCITIGFEVRDDIIREVTDSLSSPRARRSFRPTAVEVVINLSSNHYSVTMSGPLYGTTRGVGQAVFTGDDFLDCDEHRNSLVVDAVTECLRAHNKIKEG